MVVYLLQMRYQHQIQLEEVFYTYQQELSNIADLLVLSRILPTSDLHRGAARLSGSEKSIWCDEESGIKELPATMASIVGCRTLREDTIRSSPSLL